MGAAGSPVLLTGATGTVGSALFAGLVGQPGYTVVTAGRRRPATAGERHHHVQVDLADPEATEAAARHLATASLEAAVLAAGIDSRLGIEDVDHAVFTRVMQVNCLSQLQLLRRLPAAGRPRRPFTVVAVSSDVLGQGEPATVVYAASKAALEEALRHAAHDTALRVLLIRLPYIGVDMAETGEAGMTVRETAGTVPRVAHDAVTATLEFMSRTGDRSCVETWR